VYKRSDRRRVALNGHRIIHFPMENGMSIISYEEVFVHKRIISAVKREEFISDRMYIMLRGCWSNIIVLNVHTQCEDKGDDVKDSFCEKLGHVFDQFSGNNMKILLGDFKAKVGREEIFNLTNGNEC
jgi:hypothetical protein